MVYYAWLNNDNICVNIWALKGEVLAAPNTVKIPGYNEDYIHRKYENGQWSEEKFEPIQPPEVPIEEYLIDIDFRLCMIELGL